MTPPKPASAKMAGLMTCEVTEAGGGVGAGAAETFSSNEAGDKFPGISNL